MLGEGIVTAVVGRYRHDSARSITSQHIVTYIYRYIITRNGIDSIATREHTTHLLLDHAFTLGLVLYLINIGINGSTLVCSYHIIHIDALGRQNHEGDTKDGVGTRGENQQALVAARDGEGHFGTLAVADPVALGLLDRLGPLDSIQVTQEPSGISRYT